MKRLIKKVIQTFGFKLERIHQESPLPLEENQKIDVFDLIAHSLSRDKQDFVFIQIGAHDGLTCDPIRQYVTRYHWQGVLVEPQPHVFAQLLRNYAGESHLKFENAAIAAKDGMVTLYCASDAQNEQKESMFAAFNRQHLVNLLGKDGAIREIQVPAISLNTLVAKYAFSHVDLVQVDTEGFDYDIIKLLLASTTLRPSVIQFEHIHLSEADKTACVNQLVDHGYRLASTNTDTVAFRTKVRAADSQ